MKSYLLGHALLSEEQVLRAEDYALTRNIPLDEAIVFLDLMDYAELGRFLSEIFKRPYRSVLAEAPPASAKEKVPVKFATSLKVFPVAFDAKENLLALAVDDPEEKEKKSRLQVVFPPPIRLSLSVASRPEIEKAIEVYYLGKVHAPSCELEVPEDFQISLPEESKEDLTLEERGRPKKKILLLEPDLDRAKALETILHKEGHPEVAWALSPSEAAKVLKKGPFDLVLVNGRAFQPKGAWTSELKEIVPPTISYYDMGALLLGQEHPYHMMSEALLGLVTHVVRDGLKNDSEQLKEVLSRVKYCKQLAFRLHLTPAQIDAAVLAAWLSGGEPGKSLLERVRTPYLLEQVVDPAHDADHEGRIEGVILDLVTKFQALRKARPIPVRDLNTLRRLLIEQFESASKAETVLEAFLGLLRDEEFLSKLDQPLGRILIVDPSQTQGSSLMLRLVNEGYEVETAADARVAAKRINQTGADLVISEVDLPDIGGIKFCRALRENPKTAHLPFFFLTDGEGERVAVESLEAGADDFLLKPADPEVIVLKVRRALAAKSPKEKVPGVRGSLEQMGSMDFIQSLSTGEKDVRISLENQSEKGDIFIQGGDITHAQVGDLEGEEAFYRLVSWQEGEFLIMPCEQFPARTIFGGTMSLLMEGARLFDEAEGPEE